MLNLLRSWPRTAIYSVCLVVATITAAIVQHGELSITQEGVLTAPIPTATSTVYITETAVPTIEPVPTETITVIATPIETPTSLPTFTSEPIPTPTLTPTATRNPRNHANGLKIWCLVQKHHLIKKPC